MKNKIANILKITSIAIPLASCGVKNDMGKLNSSNVPQWVYNPYDDSVTNNGVDRENIIAGIGSSDKIINGGIPFQIKQAEFNAKSNLASQIKTEVNRESKEKIKLVKDQNKKDALEKNFEEQTEQIVKNVNLSMAKRTHIWQDPKSEQETLYVRLVVDKESVKDQIAAQSKSI